MHVNTHWDASTKRALGGRERGPRDRHDHQGPDLAHCQIGQCLLYGYFILTTASRVDVMNRLGRAMADPTRSRILLSLLDEPGYPAKLARNLELTRTNVSNHLSCLRGCGIVVAEPESRQTRYEIADPHIAAALTALVDVTLSVDESVPCMNPQCPVPDCCDAGADR